MNSREFNALIKEAKNKNSRAMGILSEYCVKVVKSRIIYRFGNIRDVEDLARDAVTYKILSNLPDYYVDTHLAWLFKIADNYVLTIVMDEVPVDEYNDNIKSSNDVDKIVNEIMVKDALHKLDKLTCEILVLTYYCGLDSNEVGKKLNMTPDAVRQRISRGRKIFKKYVTD